MDHHTRWAIVKSLRSVSQSVLFATVAPLDGGRVHVISLSMQSLTPPGQDDSGGIDDDEGDEFGPNHCVCVTSSSSRPEDATDKLVRRLAMDAVWCTQLRIDPQDDLGVQTFDEKVRKIHTKRRHGGVGFCD